MNRRSFIKTVSALVAGLATGLGLLKSKPALNVIKTKLHTGPDALWLPGGVKCQMKVYLQAPHYINGTLYERGAYSATSKGAKWDIKKV